MWVYKGFSECFMLFGRVLRVVRRVRTPEPYVQTRR